MNKDLQWDLRKAAEFLFTCFRRQGLPESVALFVQTIDKVKKHLTPEYTIFLTPRSIDECIKLLPEDAHIELSPFPLRDNNDIAAFCRNEERICSSKSPNGIDTKLYTNVIALSYIEHWVADNSYRKCLPFFTFSECRVSKDGGGGYRRDETGIAIVESLISQEDYYLAVCAMEGVEPGEHGDRVTCCQYEDKHFRLSLTDFVRGMKLSEIVANQIHALDNEGFALEHPITLRNYRECVLDLKRFNQSGRNLEVYKRLGRRADRQRGHDKVEFLVSGVLAKGALNVLVGPPMVGKSTAANEGAVGAARDDGVHLFLGQSIIKEIATGTVAILSGEDSDAIINARLEVLDPGDLARRLLIYAQDPRPLAEICAELAKLKSLSFVVIDPARRYLIGDEDGSDSVNNFFKTLEYLIAHTGTTVLVLHHLHKNANPTSLQAVKEAIRGSAVWVDRPRVLIGMYRRGDRTMAGIVKHNIPPAYPMMTEMAFIRDPVTLRHVPVMAKDTTAADNDDAESDALERKVLVAIERLRSEGKTILRTGATELWQHNTDELAGIGRNRLRDVVDKLIADGLITANPAGLEVAL